NHFLPARSGLDDGSTPPTASRLRYRTPPATRVRTLPVPCSPIAAASTEYSAARLLKSSEPSNVTVEPLPPPPELVVPRNLAPPALASSSPDFVIRARSPPESAAPAAPAVATNTSAIASMDATTHRRRRETGTIPAAYREVGRSLPQAASSATAAHTTIATSAGTRNRTAPYNSAAVIVTIAPRASIGRIGSRRRRSMTSPPIANG